MREFLEGLAITVILIIIGTVMIFPALLVVFLRGKNENNIGTNMNNETKEYVEIYKDRYPTYGVTEDGTRELLKSYKFKK